MKVLSIRLSILIIITLSLTIFSHISAASQISTSEEEGGAYTKYEKTKIWSLGIEFFGFKDDEEVNASFNIGPSLTIPLTIDIYKGFGIRTGFSGGYGKGSSHISYTLDPDVEISPTHLAFYEMFFDMYFTFKVHPTFHLITPYLGIGPAIFWVYTYPDLPANLFFLIDPAQNDMDDPNNIDPYSVNVKMGLDLFIGLHFYISRLVSFNAEFSFNNAYIEEASMRKSKEEYEYTRLPYNLSLVRLGGGVEFKF